MATDYTTLTDAQLQSELLAIQAEQAKRAVRGQAQAALDAQNASALAAKGAKSGGEWQQPTGDFDFYGKGATVTHNGKTWVSLVAVNVWEPGVANWREQSPTPAPGGNTPAAPAAWRQPTGATDAYHKGDQVTFQGSVYTSTIDANVWSPTDYPAGWTKA